MTATTARELARQWVGRLAPYRQHCNDEHREALVEEALRYTGLHLENDLSRSTYWTKAPLARRVAVLLFLVDRGVVVRRFREDYWSYEPTSGAEKWITSQPALAPYLVPTLELIAALRREQARRAASRRP